MKRRTPPKQRHRERPTRRDFPRAEQPTGEPPYITSHHSGQFEDPGYGSGHGTFGFTHHTNP